MYRITASQRRTRGTDLRHVVNAVLAALPLVVVACGEQAGSGVSAQPTTSGAGSTPVTIAVSAPVSAAVPSSAAASSLTGVWRGSFESKKATVALDAGVKDPAWSRDDGRAHAGKGEIDLQVGADGIVRGTLRGALGNAIVAGTAEGQTLTMTFTPKVGDDSGSISGVIVLRLENAKLSGELKGSSGDASLVRAGTVELERSES